MKKRFQVGYASLDEHRHVTDQSSILIQNTYEHEMIDGLNHSDASPLATSVSVVKRNRVRNCSHDDKTLQCSEEKSPESYTSEGRHRCDLAA